MNVYEKQTFIYWCEYIIIMTVINMDQEDINFLEDLAEELRRIDSLVYESEAVELENIIFRIKGGK